MKKQLTGLWILAVVLSMAFLISSCAPGAQNTNTAANANQNAANTKKEGTELVISDSEDPCKDSNPGGKLSKLKKAIEDKIKNNDGGDDPLAPQLDRNFYLEFKEATGPEYGYVVAYVSGAIQGERAFKRLAEFIEDFVKKGCKIKVVYRASTKLVTAFPPVGFEWCEYPMIACPGGFCAETCPLMESNSNKGNTANSNTNSGTNSNPSRSP